MRVFAILLVALAAAPGRAATALRPGRRRHRSARRRPPPPAARCWTFRRQSATRLSRSRPGCPAPIPAPCSTAVMLCFEKQGGSPVVEANTYLYYMQAKGSRPSLNEWIAYDDTVAAGRARRLQAAVGDELPRRSRDRGPRRPLRERRPRQGARLQHGGAPARQDRRLRRDEEGRHLQDRRSAQGEGDLRSGSTRSSIPA